MEQTFLDRFTARFAPKWTLQRVRARMALEVIKRHYEAASRGRRTQGWSRQLGGVNSILAVALSELRIHARELIRNNGWARRAQRIVANHTVGWGIRAKALGGPPGVMELWKAWAESTEPDPERRLTFNGIQYLIAKNLFESGEMLIRRRPRLPKDGLAIPLQLQVLEPEYVDTNKTGEIGIAGGPIRLGVEFDRLGRRAAYWLFDSDPATGDVSSAVSRRIPASEILHVFDTDRAAQSRGASWLGTSIVPLKDLDEFEDAEMVHQKVAACFAAFVEDPEGNPSPLGEESEDDELVQTLEPGTITHLSPGKKVTFGTPPSVVEGGFSQRHLRKIFVGNPNASGDLTQMALGLPTKILRWIIRR